MPRSTLAVTLRPSLHLSGTHFPRLLGDGWKQPMTSGGCVAAGHLLVGGNQSREIDR